MTQYLSLYWNPILYVCESCYQNFGKEYSAQKNLIKYQVLYTVFIRTLFLVFLENTQSTVSSFQSTNWCVRFSATDCYVLSLASNYCVLFSVHKLLRTVLNHKPMCHVVSPQTAVSCCQSTNCCVLFWVHKLLCPVVSQQTAVSCTQSTNRYVLSSVSNYCVLFSVHKLLRTVLSLKPMCPVLSPQTAVSSSQSTNCCVLLSVHKLLCPVVSPQTAVSCSQSTNCYVLFSVVTSEFSFTEFSTCSCWILPFCFVTDFVCS